MTNLKPEERAREWIDRKLEDAGWKVINRDEYAPGMSAVAVREAAMRGAFISESLTDCRTCPRRDFASVNTKHLTIWKRPSKRASAAQSWF